MSSETPAGTADSDGVGLEDARPVRAYGAAVRTRLRDNSTAYGFSVSITAGFGLVSTAHGQSAFAAQSVLFAIGAVAGFLTSELVAALLIRKRSLAEPGEVPVVEGLLDVLAIMAAVGVAVGMARVPGLVAWPLTAYGVTFVYLLVGGFDVLIARRVARRREA